MRTGERLRDRNCVAVAEAEPPLRLSKSSSPPKTYQRAQIGSFRHRNGGKGAAGAGPPRTDHQSPPRRRPADDRAPEGVPGTLSAPISAPTRTRIRPIDDPEEAAIGRPTPTAHRLVEASVSPNTRRAYAGALRRLDAWLAGHELDDVALAAYLAELHDAGRASSSASMAVADMVKDTWRRLLEDACALMSQTLVCDTC